MAETRVILLTGGTGQVGSELAVTLAPLGRVVSPTRAELDLADLDAVRQLVRALRPAAVVNAAAYTAVDRAEHEVDLCTRINGEAPGVLAEEAARLRAPMIHYSTDYVFDGEATRPYSENDRPNPLNAYGRAKLEGERAVTAAGGGHVILRTSWIYGVRGSNFVRTMLRLGSERSELSIVDDQVGTPNFSRSIARATATVLRHLLETRDSTLAGVYHLSSGGSTTWYRFACAIFDLQRRDDPPLRRESAPRLIPISSAEYPSAVRRPTYSVLDSAAAFKTFGISMPEWQSDLEVVMRELTSSSTP